MSRVLLLSLFLFCSGITCESTTYGLGKETNYPSLADPLPLPLPALLEEISDPNSIAPSAGPATGPDAEESTITELPSTTVDDTQSSSTPTGSFSAASSLLTSSAPKTSTTLAPTSPFYSIASATKSTLPPSNRSPASDTTDPTPSSTAAYTTLFNASVINESSTEHPHVLHDPIGTRMLLFTRKHPSSALLLVAGDPNTILEAVTINANQPTRFIVHGAFDGIDSSHWLKDMKNKFLQIEDPNIILVDWSKGASANLPDQRLTNVRMLGHQMIVVIEDLMKYRGVKAEDVHIIAHGCATFAADVVGRAIKNLGRISGLDPGGPNFDSLHPDMRLDKSDALFVDVIHTDAQNTTLSLYGRGTSMALGHMDFYPNGGLDQPGCSIQRFEDLITRPIGEGIRRFVACHHYRSVDYYMETITPASTQCVKLAYQCENYTDYLAGNCDLCDEENYFCAQMGFYSIRQHKAGDTLTRKLYVITNRRQPFCLYHYSIQVKVAKIPEQSRGGFLLLRITGEYGQMETRINGGMAGFKSGNTTGMVTTHHMDIGAVKSLTLAWLPAPSINLFSNPTLKIKSIQIKPLSLSEPTSRVAMMRTLCPAEKNGEVSPFYRETFFTATEIC